MNDSDGVKFMGILATALKAGNDATEDWDPNDWFPCGSGSVLVKPRNSVSRASTSNKFARWLLNTFPERGSTMFIHDADYKKAVIITPLQFNQAMDPQIKWSSGVCGVLRDNNIKAEMWGYID